MPYSDPAKNAAAKRAYVRRRQQEGLELWRIESLDRVRRYQLKHPERAKASRKKYIAANPVNSLIWQAQDRARRNGLACDLKLGDLQIPTHCPVLGIEIKHSLKLRSANSPSIDRVNPKLGYTKENVRIISWRANALKRDGTIEEFEKIIAYIKENS